MSKKLNVGLLGLGRLGRVYARDLTSRIPAANLVMVADLHAPTAEEVARIFNVANFSTDSLELLENDCIDAVIIATPTKTHRELVLAAAQRGRAIFCEKPLSLSLDEAVEMKEILDRTGAFFQMGFMRRFDAGYRAAKMKVEAGDIGVPVLFKSTSRDPFPPPLEYVDPRNSGGLIVDMGIHDIDLARWFLGPVKTVHSVGGVLAFPEFETVGDIDNAVVTLTFSRGQIGVIDLSRNAVYGYDISSEILGTKGALRIGYLRETPLLVMTRDAINFDTVPHFMQRFEEAYTRQLEDFIDNVLQDKDPSVTIQDGLEALRIGIAATRSLHTGQPVSIADIEAAGSG